MFYSARFGVTEIGEKEKMKSKLLATLVVLVLLCGIFAAAINIGRVEAVAPPYYLTVATNPYPSIPTIPAPGKYDYSNIAWQNCTAPLEYIVGTTKYLFKNWTVTPKTDDYTLGANNEIVWVHLDGVYQNKTATAYYNTQYKLHVETLYSTGYSEIDAAGWITHPPDRWIDAGSNVHVGVPVDEVIIQPSVEKAVFDHWEINSVVDGTNRISSWFIMNGPKSCVAFWKIQWYLKVLSGSPPPPPAGEGYYPEKSTATLVAPSPPPGWIIPNVAQWVFDVWKLDGVSQLPPNPTLNVYMDKNHTATVFYKRQSFVTLRDDIGNQSGIWDNGKWYDNCVVYKFTAKMYVDLDSNHRYGFIYWVHSSLGVVGYTNEINLHINSTSDGATLKAVYHMQYYLTLKTDPTGVATIPGSGFYPAGSVLPGPYVAPMLVDIVAGKSRWHFYQWVRTSPPGWSGTVGDNNLVGITMDQPKTFTAYYDMEWHRFWSQSPTSITVPGFPNDDWVKNGTLLNWWAPATDLSTQFVFWYWNIDGTTYAQGQQTVPILHDHSIVGTAYYANQTKMYMSPDRHEETAHAYCNKFNVTIYASNFDADRQLYGGRPMDIYGFDIIIDFDPNLLEVQDVYLNLENFFAPNQYFIAVNKVDNTAGTYRLVASVKGNYTGFEGTKAIFTLTFHVIYDPCYPYWESDWISFSYARLVNHLDQEIWPELGYNNCLYVINTVQPWLEIRDAVDKDSFVIVHKNSPQTFFDVEVYLHSGVKVHDFYVLVDFDKTQINAVNVVIANYLKPPYAIYAWWIWNAGGEVGVEVAQETGPQGPPLQNCSGLLFTIRFKVVDQIFYKIPGPWTLESDIEISYGELSVMCNAGPYDQTTTNGYLGSKSCQYVYNPLPGDLDFDGEVTVLDLQLIADNYCTPKYDVTGDAHTDIFDLVFVALRFGNKIE